jgi:hypothetical protein
MFLKIFDSIKDNMSSNTIAYDITSDRDFRRPYYRPVVRRQQYIQQAASIVETQNRYRVLVGKSGILQPWNTDRNRKDYVIMDFKELRI